MLKLRQISVGKREKGLAIWYEGREQQHHNNDLSVCTHLCPKCCVTCTIAE